MTDLRTLLHEAAPLPSGPLDMGSVRRRAARLRVRRATTWLAGVLAVAGVTLPATGSGVLAPGGTGTDVGVGVGVERNDAPHPTAMAVPATGAGGGAGAAPAPTAQPRRAPDGTARSAGGATQPDGPALGDVQPPAPSCSVDDAGLREGEQRVCRFTATKAGGAGLRSDGAAQPTGARGDVYYVRNGVRSHQRVEYQRAGAGGVGVFACAEFLEPGDLVEVVVTAGAARPDRPTSTLGAGEGWSCWQGS